MQTRTLPTPCATVSAGVCFGPPRCRDRDRNKGCTPVRQATNTSLGKRTALATRKMTRTTPITEVAVGPCRSIRQSTAQRHTHAFGAAACALLRSAGGAFGTAWNAMYGRAIRTSCSSMPTTAASATAALARAAALLERTWAGSVGGAELHRSHRMQTASLPMADTCYPLQRARCMLDAERRMNRASTALRALRAHAGSDLLAALLGRISAESAASLGRDLCRLSVRRHFLLRHSLCLLAHPD